MQDKKGGGEEASRHSRLLNGALQQTHWQAMKRWERDGKKLEK